MRSGLVALLVLFAVRAGAQTGKAEEVLPNLWVAETLEWQGRTVEIGMSREQVLTFLGNGYKSKKPSRYSAQKFRSERDFMLRWAPWEAAFSEQYDRLGKQCGAQCWAEGLFVKIGKKEQIRVMMLGAEKDDVRASLIVLDRGHSAFSAGRAFADAASGARYVVTDDQVYRISQIGPTIRIEKIK